MVDSGRSDCVNILKGYCVSLRNLDSSVNGRRLSEEPNILLLCRRRIQYNGVW